VSRRSRCRAKLGVCCNQEIETLLTDLAALQSLFATAVAYAHVSMSAISPRCHRGPDEYPPPYVLEDVHLTLVMPYMKSPHPLR